MDKGGATIRNYNPKEAGLNRSSCTITADMCDKWMQKNTFYCKKTKAYVSREGCKKRLNYINKHKASKNGMQRWAYLDIANACLDCRRFKV